MSRTGTKVTAENANHRITRNVSHFKRINASFDNNRKETVESDDDSEFEHENVNMDEGGDRENRNIQGPVRARKAPDRYGNPIPSGMLRV